MRVVALLLSLSLPSVLSAEVKFARDVRPILAGTCFKCHGPDLKKGELDLQSFATATANKAIVPGKSVESEVMRRVLLHEGDERMPPKGERLSPKQIETLKVWIDTGATYEEHWSYIPPKRPAGSIDDLIRREWSAVGLTPTPVADKWTLLRRVSLDLTGLPPTPEDWAAYEADSQAGAYERAVDRLLARPQYGEHMARWWLDLARYADTNGYEKDGRRTIWPYRDWVIDAFNADMPFDRFTIEQLAGDLLPNATKSQKVATGFHRNTLINTEGGTDDEEFRVAAVVDRVNTTMTVWMGSTVACAQCHNHKFDPISQKDYFRLYAFFNSSTDRGRSMEPELPVPTAEEIARKQASTVKVVRPIVSVLLPGATWSVVSQVKHSLPVAASAAKLAGGIKPATTLVMQELPNPRVTQVHVRGNHKNFGDVVTPGVPGKWHPLPATKQPNRLDLARWLVSPKNPLVGRVTMNRIWARLMGHAIVETSDDFGIQGEAPTHPELLDLLAVKFVEQGWSLKRIQREIVLTDAYRRSSRVTADALTKDPNNRLYARGSRTRLDAETVRDNVLTISGLLDRKIGGPSVFPFQPEGVWSNPYSGDRWTLSEQGNQYRRGLYTFWRRTAPYANFMTFDAPSREICTERRPKSNTPLQALAVLNDKSFTEAANALARRVIRESNDVDYAFRLCVTRPPTDGERAALQELLTDVRKRYEADPVAAKKLGGGDAQLAAWTTVANVLLNLDETITRE